MISRKGVLERSPADELDGLIRWALRERVDGAVPSPQVWERIRERVERRAAPKWARLDLTFLSTLVVWLLADTCPPSFVILQPTWRGEIVMRKHDLAGARALGRNYLATRLAF